MTIHGTVRAFNARKQTITLSASGATLRMRLAAGRTFMASSQPPKVGSDVTVTASVQDDTLEADDVQEVDDNDQADANDDNQQAGNDDQSDDDGAASASGSGSGDGGSGSGGDDGGGD